MLLQILEVSADQNQNGPGYRVHGSMRVVDQDSGADLDPTGQAAAAAAAKGEGAAAAAAANGAAADLPGSRMAHQRRVCVCVYVCARMRTSKAAVHALLHPQVVLQGNTSAHAVVWLYTLL